MRLKIIFSIATMLIFPAVLCLNSVSSAQESGMPKEVITTIDDLAKDLASLMAHPGIRNHVRVAVNKSSKREKIVFLNELMDSMVKMPGLPAQAQGKAKGLLTKARSAKKRFSESNIKQVLVSSHIDVYFPVKNHRKKWTGGDDVLIAVGNLDDNPKQVKVYSVKTQQARFISGAAPPAEPVLFVSPCEHETHEAVFLKESDIPPAKSVPPPKGKQSYILTNWFWISNDHEPWTSGDPEIYVWVTQARTNRTLIPVKKLLPGVNKEKTWKDLRGCPTALGFYWDSSYDRITYYKVMEEDYGTYVSTPVTVAYNGFSVSFKLTIRNKDDSLGTVNVDRNQIGWCGSTVGNCCQTWNTITSTGEARMKMTLSH